MLSTDELLQGAQATHAVAVPPALLGDPEGNAGEVVLRPLTVRDVRRINQAAGEGHVLASVLMVQQALVEPNLSVEEVGGMPAGLVKFLLSNVNRVSGLELGEEDLESAVKAPMARACFVLSKEFGWTPAECSELTIGQVLLYLEMLARGEAPEETLQ
ncbi:MAG: hypothetical protein AAGF13_07115 [Pseudomonadota bacterium]